MMKVIIVKRFAAEYRRRLMMVLRKRSRASASRLRNGMVGSALLDHNSAKEFLTG